MSLPTLRLPLLRGWPAAPGITAGLRRLLVDTSLALPELLSETEREEIVDLLILFLDMPARVVARPEEARPGELSILAFPLDRDPRPVPAKGVLVYAKRRAPGDLRLEITHQIITLRDAIIQSLGRKHSGTRLQAVALWAAEVTDSPSTALRFAGGALARHMEDPLADDASLYIAGLVAAIAWLLRGVDTRIAQWAMALATGAPHPSRLVSSEALLLGQDAAQQRLLEAGLALILPYEPSDALELRRPLELLRHLDIAMMPLKLADITKVLAPALDPSIRLVFDRLFRPDRKPLGLEGPKTVHGFLGRSEEIDRLSSLFEPANEIRTTVLYGMSGVGKAQVAAALGQMLSGRLEPVWVRFAEGPEAGWLRVASALGIDPNVASAQVRDRAGVPRWVKQVHDELRFLPCLLVVDGVDAMRGDNLPPWLPSGPGTSAVLVLSESPQRPLQRVHEAIAVKLSGLSVEASRQLLANKASRLREEILRGDADKLIAQVGGHPAALSMAAALLEHKSLEEVTEAVRRGEHAIPEVLQKVIAALPDSEAKLLCALLVCSPAGSIPDLALKTAGIGDGREALDRLLDRSLVVSGGRTVRLTEVVRLEGERRLDKEPERRRTLDLAHAQAVLAMFTEARVRGDLTTQEDLVGDLSLAVERFTERCKGGEGDASGLMVVLADALRDAPSGDRGKHAQLAVAAYKAALSIVPDNAGLEIKLGLGYERVGDELRTRGDTTGALAAYRSDLDIMDRLTQKDPGSAEWQRHLSMSQRKIGDMLLKQGDRPGALAAFQVALTIAERLTQKDPGNVEWQRDLFWSHEKIGNVLVEQDDIQGALAAFQSGWAITERLTQKDPDNAEWQRDLAVCCRKIGRVLLKQGDRTGALAAVRSCLAIAERLTQKDPSNAEWQRELSIGYYWVGHVLVRQGDRPGALEAFRKGLTIAERLVQQHPSNAEWQRDVSSHYIRIGDALLEQDDRSDALAAFQASLRIRERLARLDPGNAQWQTDLALACEKVADALGRGTAADRVEARAYLERARRILTELASTSRLTREKQRQLTEIEKRLQAV